MVSNFSLIPIHWLLTVDSKMAFFLSHSLAEGLLVRICVNEKDFYREIEELKDHLKKKDSQIVI